MMEGGSKHPKLRKVQKQLLQQITALPLRHFATWLGIPNSFYIEKVFTTTPAFQTS